MKGGILKYHVGSLFKGFLNAEHFSAETTALSSGDLFGGRIACEWQSNMREGIVEYPTDDGMISVRAQQFRKLPFSP